MPYLGKAEQMKSWNEEFENLGKMIKEKFGIGFIYGEQEFDPPEKPFISIAVQSISLVQNVPAEERINDFLHRTKNEEYEVVIGVRAVTKQVYEAIDILTKLRNWLQNEAYYDLSLKNIVIVNCGNILPAVQFMVIDYNQNFEFTCRFRSMKTETVILPIIDYVKIPRPTIKG